MTKKSNIQQVKEMLDGTHKTQQRKVFGFESVSETSKKHNVGDIWEEYDIDGKVCAIWEQKNGYRVKNQPGSDSIRALINELESFPNCYDDCEKKKTKLYGAADKRFGLLRGMCTDCVTKFETKLKVQGKFEEYQKLLMANNAISFFKDADREIQMLTDEVSKDMEYVNADGRNDVWKAAPDAANQILREYGEYKKIVLNKLGINEEEE